MNGGIVRPRTMMPAPPAKNPVTPAVERSREQVLRVRSGAGPAEPMPDLAPRELMKLARRVETQVARQAQLRVGPPPGEQQGLRLVELAGPSAAAAAQGAPRERLRGRTAAQPPARTTSFARAASVYLPTCQLAFFRRPTR